MIEQDQRLAASDVSSALSAALFVVQCREVGTVDDEFPLGPRFCRTM
jgi:hypothetical protein